MANKRLSKEKQTLVLMALCEGMPIRAAARMFKVGKNAIHRLICETGEAFRDYMDKNFRDLPCIRIEMDEQWQYAAVTLAGFRRTTRQSAETIGCGAVSTRIQSWFSRTRLESAIGGPATRLSRMFAIVCGFGFRSQPTIIGHTLFTSGNISDMKAIATEPKQRYSASRSCQMERWRV